MFDKSECLEAVLGCLGAVLGGLGRSWSGLGLPLLPPSGLVTTPTLNPPPSQVALKPLLTSLHFSALFLLRLGCLLGSISDPFWLPKLA